MDLARFYRGDIVNSIAFEAAGAHTDPQPPANGLPPATPRYSARAPSLRRLRQPGHEVTSGTWNPSLQLRRPSHRFSTWPTASTKALAFNARLRVDLDQARNCARHPSLAAHEALLLNYEQAFNPPGQPHRRLVRTAPAHALDATRTAKAPAVPCGIHGAAQTTIGVKRPAPAPKPGQLLRLSM